MKELNCRDLEDFKFKVIQPGPGKKYTVNQYSLKSFPKELSSPYAIFQFTGLKDKEGKEIYEGDIIEYKIEFDKKTKYKTVIKDIDLIFGFREFQYDEYSNFNTNLNTIKIIGNIYENPELLNEKI